MPPIRNKLRIYEAVYDFNHSMEEAIEKLRGLEALQVFPRRFLRAGRQVAEELRANTNRRLTEVLNLRERKDAARLNRAKRKRRAC